jgi:FeS assembly protein IscX
MHGIQARLSDAFGKGSVLPPNPGGASVLTNLLLAYLTTPPLSGNPSPVKLTWKDHEEIAWALIDKFPDQDPLRLSFPKLHKMVLELEGFSDKPDASNEKILENIQMAWYEEKQ